MKNPHHAEKNYDWQFLRISEKNVIFVLEFMTEVAEHLNPTTFYILGNLG